MLDFHTGVSEPEFSFKFYMIYLTAPTVGGFLAGLWYCHCDSVKAQIDELKGTPVASKDERAGGYDGSLGYELRER